MTLGLTKNAMCQLLPFDLGRHDFNSSIVLSGCGKAILCENKHVNTLTEIIQIHHDLVSNDKKKIKKIIEKKR